MSSVVFPALPGLKWDVKKEPQFRTRVYSAVSGREARTKMMLYPLWTFRLSYDVLRQTGSYNELKQLAGLFLQMGGKFDSFLFNDVDDDAVTDETFAVTDGVETVYQLSREFGSGGFSLIEPVANVNVLTNIKRAGTPLSSPADYTIDNEGVVTLVAAGSGGDTLTWSGTYYFRCRFVQDTSEFNQFMQNLWDLKQLDLIGSLGIKV